MTAHVDMGRTDPSKPHGAFLYTRLNFLTVLTRTPSTPSITTRLVSVLGQLADIYSSSWSIFNCAVMSSHTASQRYLSTRGGSYDVSMKQDIVFLFSLIFFLQLSFEEVVLKGLANDGGLFIPEEIPRLPADWASKWLHLSFSDLAHEIFSLYISPSEIPSADLKDIIERSYSTFRTKEVTPTVTLDKEQNIHLLELFHGPTFAFKDVALQFLGNLFEYFLVRRNEGKQGREREHLTVIGATSGDTGSAAIYGLRGKKDVSVFIMHPLGKVSPIQEAQMTTVMDANVHNLAVDGTFDDCQVSLSCA